MTHYQPAYWLSRDPAAAANFLARTAVASRLVGGFVKSADIMDPEMKKILINSAIGAGAGGLGGLGVGLFSKRKKNPLTTALTGATIGGVLGGALPPAYEAMKKYWNAEPAAKSPAEIAQEVQHIKSLNEADPWSHLAHRFTGKKLPISTGPAKPGQLSAYDQAESQTSTPSLVAKGLVKSTGDVANAAGELSGVTTNPGVAVPAYGAAFGLDHMLQQLKKNRMAHHEFYAGASALPPIVPTIRGASLDPMKPKELQEYQTMIQNNAARRLADQMANETGTRNNIMRAWREAQLGRELNLLESGRTSRIFGAPNPDLPGSAIGALRNAGRKIIGPPTVRSRIGRGVVRSIPFLGAAALTKASEP